MFKIQLGSQEMKKIETLNLLTITGERPLFHVKTLASER